MERSQFSFSSDDGIDIQVYCWKNNDIPTRGIIQIAHGMAEHALRYESFSHFMTNQGFIVYANDHRGHGKSIQTSRGFFAEKAGFQKAVKDVYQLSTIIHEQHPNLPLFLLGHSMGSFLSRRYIQVYRDNIDGVILSGTGGDKKLLGKIGLLIAKTEGKIRGKQTPSPLMDKLTFGNYNKQFSPARTKFDFLTRDTTVVDDYIEDDDCGFICTTSFYADLISGLDLIHQDKEVAKIDKHLPIFLISGDKDPVGNNGKDVQAIYEQYNKHGIENVSIKLYEDGRHEMLNEINKEEVYEDVVKWLETIMKGDVT